MSSGSHVVLLSEVVFDCRSFVNLLVLVSAHVADIACIAQATLKWIHHALLTHKRRLVFSDLNFILDLSTCVNWLISALIFWLRTCSQLFTYYVCRFLVSGPGNTILTGASLLPASWVCESSDTFDSMNLRMVHHHHINVVTFLAL